MLSKMIVQNHKLNASERHHHHHHHHINITLITMIVVIVVVFVDVVIAEPRSGSRCGRSISNSCLLAYGVRSIHFGMSWAD